MLGTGYLMGELAAIVGGRLEGSHDAAIQNVIFDSRLATGRDDELFLALKGDKDGHDFINDAWNRGVRLFMVEKMGAEPALPDAGYIIVEDVLAALQLWAARHRRRFKPEVIAITGSNGKTIVKEWLAGLLAPEFNIVRSQMSYNSQMGVALALLQMGPLHTLALIEAGISTAGEMDRLRQMIAPTVGIFTTLGSAHDAGFSSRDEKLGEKLKLYRDCGAQKGTFWSYSMNEGKNGQTISTKGSEFGSSQVCPRGFS